MEWHKLNQETVQQELSELGAIGLVCTEEGKRSRQGEEVFE
jgi:hypothetical protein